MSPSSQSLNDEFDETLDTIRKYSDAGRTQRRNRLFPTLSLLQRRARLHPLENACVGHQVLVFFRRVSISRLEPVQSARNHGEPSMNGQQRCSDCRMIDFDKSAAVNAIYDVFGFAIHDFDNSTKFFEVNPADGVNSDKHDERRKQYSCVDWVEVCTVTNGTQRCITWTFDQFEDFGDATIYLKEIGPEIVANCYRCPEYEHDIAGSNETAGQHRKV